VTKSVFTKQYSGLREILIEARTAAGLSQAELARLLDRPQSFVSKYERGERRLDVIEFLQVTTRLNIDPAKILAKL